jgi:flavodoxin I
MKALVVYDSVFGNTEKIAQAIGAALTERVGPLAEIKVQRVGSVTPEQLAGVELLFVGSPTRAFQPTPATKAFLASIPGRGLKGVRAAAFDTRADLKKVNSVFLNFMVKVFGYAAPIIDQGLRRKGASPAASPEGFLVVDTEGPLAEGELERAASWARKLC